jgi:viral A-type inclusion protein, putative
MQLVNLGKTKFENIIKLNDIPIKTIEIDKNIINDYKEVNDIILNKKSTVSLLIENDKNFVDYIKKYGIEPKEILENIKKNIKLENKEFDKTLKNSELDKKYFWYLENKDNKNLKNVIDTKKNTYLLDWGKDINNLENDEKISYLRETNDVNFKNEIYNFSIEKIKEVLKLYENFKNEYTDNQKSYLKNNGVDINFEEKENINIDTIENLNNSYINEKEKINNVLGILKITIDDISVVEDNIRKRNTDLKDYEISDMLANYIYDNMIKENISLVDFSKKEDFNFNSNNEKLLVNVERYFDLKDNNSLNDFKEEDLVPLGNENLNKTLIERENTLNTKREYLLNENLLEYQELTYNAKKEIAMLLNNAHILDKEVNVAMLEIKNNKLIVLTPEFNVEITSDKINENNYDKIKNILLNELETKFSLNKLEILNKNSEVLFELGQRDKLRELGNDFYKNMIFDTEKENIKKVEVEISKEKFLELTDKEKILERAKELGITFTEKEIVKEIEKQNKDDKDNYVEKSKENDIRVNFNENRKEIFEFLSNSLMLSNALRLYEEINEYDYSIMYSKDNLEDNLKYVISNLMELIPEINNNPEYFDINSMKTFIENAKEDSLQELITEFDNSIKETLNIDSELNEFENNNNLDNSFENNNENITKNTNNKKKEKDDLDYE